MTYQLQLKYGTGWHVVHFALNGEQYAEATLEAYRVKYPGSVYRLVENNVSELEAQCADYGVGK
ncbi:hypothetical protein [Synechococcus phage S-N03]|uniref:Uncharacterized protein n=1 Tax=Synechococcus phage S-N03 TaxID=2718943 RepID=A0A6G8R5H5_9CAUD|nr:hypothetical protein PQC09_gp032 [Synechococcus phage S-N03]QIN96667.1 hypothetical protein [Synechococcus phage S-N03]